MVYLHFPANLTEEELMLQAKYNKLKRKVRLKSLLNSKQNLRLGNNCIVYQKIY